VETRGISQINHASVIATYFFFNAEKSLSEAAMSRVLISVLEIPHSSRIQDEKMEGRSRGRSCLR
jgi:hypothetical protein